MGTISVSGTTTVDVDFDEEVEIDDLDDDDLRECVQEAIKRGLISADGVQYERDYVLRAYEELLSGRRHEALALLERALFCGQHMPNIAFQKISVRGQA